MILIIIEMLDLDLLLNDRLIWVSSLRLNPFCLIDGRHTGVVIQEDAFCVVY